jgi:vacuolar-type H+-ATPase subunit H
VSKSFSEIESLRNAERKAAEAISAAKKSADEIIAATQRESLKKIEYAMVKLREDMEREYRLEEANVKKEARRIISEAEKQALEIKSNSRTRITEAVEAVLEKIKGGG